MTATTRTDAERHLAALIEHIRPEWDRHDVQVEIRRHSEKPLAQVAAAALDVACRPHPMLPAVLAMPGAHWRALDRLAGTPSAPTASGTPRAGAGPVCGFCGRHEAACRRADALAVSTHLFTPSARTRARRPADEVPR